MKQLSIMIKPASSLCNLRCRYCFYADVADLREVKSYGVMTDEVMEKVLANIRCDLDKGDHVNFAFQGGEPTMAGLEYFRKFTDITSTWTGIQVTYALQTNAMVLDEEWCAFLKKYNFLVGVSWDVLSDIHDAARVDVNRNGTWKRVLESIRLMNKMQVEYNVLCTLTNSAARHPDQIWKMLEKQNIRYVQFTPCLGEMESDKENVYALSPERYASFYDRMFNLWFEAFRNGNYRSVKLFDDLVNYLAFGMPTACGMSGHCSPQLIIEADGSTYPCDFYCLDEWKIGYLNEVTLKEIYSSEKMRAFAMRPHTKPKLCGSCEFAKFCNGGCKRMQKEICCGPEDTFCGQQNFLRKHMRELQMIAMQERSYRN